MKILVLTIWSFMSIISSKDNSFIDYNNTLKPKDSLLKTSQVKPLIRKLGGKVASIKRTNWNAKDESGIIKKGSSRYIGNYHKEITYFDREGFTTKKERYGIDNELSILYSYVRNKEGVLVEENIFYINEDATNSTFYFYDKENNLIEELFYADNGYRNRSIYIYNKQGEIIETISCYPCRQSVHEINEVENSVTINETSSEERYKTKTYYDTNENEIEHLFFKNGLIYLQFKHSYDSEGNLIEISRYKPNGKVMTLYFKANFILDQHQNRTKRIEIDFNENGVRKYNEWDFTYKYDNKGNWIKRIEFKNKLPKTVILREFNYY